MRTAAAVILAILLATSGFAPAAAAASVPAPAASVSAPVATHPDVAPASTVGAAEVRSPTNATRAATTGQAAPPDPGTDRLGWEDGYWYNESVSVDQTDGLDDAELDAMVARTMARVEHIRRLEFNESVPVNVMSRQAFQNQSSSSSSVNESLRTFDNAKFEALFLINESTDSLETQESNRGASVLGYYSPARDEIVMIVPEDKRAQISELTLGHELVHALQDQRFNLSQFRARTRDGANADSGLIEGDASYVEYLYSQRCNEETGAWNGTCVRKPPSEGGGSGGDLANIGVYFVKYQPYADGPNFIATVKSSGGWAAVDALYANPPTTTEQIIDPTAYPEETARNVSFADTHSGAWERVRPPGRPDYGQVGQAAVAAMFVYPLYHSSGATQIVPPRTWLNRTSDGQISSFDPLNYDFDYASGWAGDRLHVYENADNETAYVWRIGWDTPDDAREFREGYRRVLRYWGAERQGPNTFVIPEGNGFADAFHVTRSGDTVTVVNAPTVEALSQVRAGVSVQREATPTATATATDASSTPEGPDPTAGTTTDSPGFGLTATLAALVALALLARRD